MSEPVIRAVEIGKQYTRSTSSAYVGNPTLREMLVSIPRMIARRAKAALPPDSSTGEFWALKEISFEVSSGEVLGIIGRNGAGKSTLLKILSRVILPSRGYAEISGRVGALLEVGIGFHPDLSGRENVFLNAAVLGITRQQALEQFDDIVDFAEIRPFIDMPVKRYSSGMYVRLAFSIAIHIQPDILIVDEVLSVGDIGFQKKSMGKIRDLMGDGRTVLLVSHSMETVREIADRALWIDAGRVRALGEAKKVSAAYEASFRPEQ